VIALLCLVSTAAAVSLIYSMTNGDTFGITSNNPQNPIKINNIGQGHSVGNHTNYWRGAAYRLEPGVSKLLSNEFAVAYLTLNGRRFSMDFSKFGFCIDRTGLGWYCGADGDSNVHCLYSVNLSTAEMNYMGCVDDGNERAAVNGLMLVNESTNLPAIKE